MELLNTLIKICSDTYNSKELPENSEFLVKISDIYFDILNYEVKNEYKGLAKIVDGKVERILFGSWYSINIQVEDLLNNSRPYEVFLLDPIPVKYGKIYHS